MKTDNNEFGYTIDQKILMATVIIGAIVYACRNLIF